jgi:hypothetical protein
MAVLNGRVGFCSDTEGSISETLTIVNSGAWQSDVTSTFDGRFSETGDGSFVGEVIGATLPPTGDSFDPDVMLFADDGSVTFSAGAYSTHDIYDLLVHSWQFGGPENEEAVSEVTTGFVRVGLENLYNIAYNQHYHELTYSGDDLTTVEIWQNAGKALKLFTRDLTYTGDNLTGVVTTDEVEGSVLTSTLTYAGDNLDTITKAVT